MHDDLSVCADRVARASRLYLHQRQIRIQQTREALIRQELARRPGILDRLLRRPPPTRGQVVKALKSDPLGQFNVVRITGGYWARKVQDLRKLADIVLANGGGKVFVSPYLARALQLDRPL